MTKSNLVKFIEAQKTTSGFEVSCNDGNNFLINTKYFVNASGLYSDLISQQIDVLDKKHFSSIIYLKTLGTLIIWAAFNPKMTF